MNKHYCKNCGKEFNPCHKTSVFCSKSCAVSWRNKEKVKDGTHNFNKIDRSAQQKLRIENGTHQFLSGNMSDESLKLKAEGIRNARLRESKNGTHPWQNPKNWILNEYRRSLNIAKKRGLSVIDLYISDCEFDGYFKIGWTYNTDMRSWDSRTHEIINPIKVKSGNIESIIQLEMEIKLRFFNLDISKKLNSTEIFPNSIKDEVINFINSNNYN